MHSVTSCFVRDTLTREMRQAQAPRRRLTRDEYRAALRAAAKTYTRERPRAADEAMLLRSIGTPERLIGPVRGR